MPEAEFLDPRKSSRQITRNWHLLVTIVSSVSVALFGAVLIEQGTSVALLISVSLVLCLAVFLHTRFLIQVRRQQRKSIIDLQTTKGEVQNANKQLALNRTLVQSISAEAEALRKTTLTLTQESRLDHVLDVLLQSLAELVPYQSARVLLLEDESRLFVAREKSFSHTGPDSTTFPLTLDSSNFLFLKRILKNQIPMLLTDVAQEAEWCNFASSGARSWLCVPLVAADQALGILSADHEQPNIFASEHIRMAASLAISAVAGIQNARLHERAEIYGAELERRLFDLKDARSALEQAKGQCIDSDERFQTVFQGSPIAFSIETLDTGRLVEVNKAFEHRYGYSRSELIGCTVHELGICENPIDRELMISRLHQGAPIYNMLTRFRTKAGELKLTASSADRINFDGKACIFFVSGDLPQEYSNLIN